MRARTLIYKLYTELEVHMAQTLDLRGARGRRASPADGVARRRPQRPSTLRRCCLCVWRMRVYLQAEARMHVRATTHRREDRREDNGAHEGRIKKEVVFGMVMAVVVATATVCS